MVFQHLSGRNRNLNSEKKPFSDPRWREWPKTGIKFGEGHAPEKVHETIQQWIKEIEAGMRNNDNGKR